MLNRPIPKSSKVGVFGTIVIIIAAVLLPMAKAQKLNKGNVPVTGRTDRATSGVRVRKVLVRGEPAYAGILETPDGKVSPDGRYFSFTDWRSNTGSSWLRIRDLQTGEIRDITKPPTDKDQNAKDSIWSPDGKQIAYKCTVRRLRPPRRPNKHVEIRIARLDGSEPRVIVEGDEGQNIWVGDWSSDGKHLVGAAGKDIVMISVEDGSMRVLKTLQHALIDWEMRISPDGRFIVYAHAPNEDDPFQRDIFLLATDGSRDAPLIEHPSHDYDPVWTPDGKGIVFVSNRTGATGIWMLKVVNGQPQGRPKLIKQTTGWVHAKGFTKDGSYYYEVRLGYSDIYVAALDPETGRLLGTPTKLKLPYEGWNSAPAWSPDGQYIAYISRRDFTRSAGYDFPPVLTIYSVNSGKVRELSPQPWLLLHYGPQWSPDGRSLLVSGRDSSWKKPRGIYRIDVRTNKTTLIVSAKSEDGWVGQPVWTPDGKVLIYNQFIFDKRRTVPVLLRNVETGQEKELWRGVVGWNRPVAVSPDGQQVAILEWAPWEAWGHLRRFLRVMPISGGEARDLIRFQKWANTAQGSLSWTPDGRYILFAKRRQGSGPVLYRIPSEGGEPQELDVGTETDSGKFSLHPDGKRIAFTGPGRGAELWVMDNFLPAEEAGGQ